MSQNLPRTWFSLKNQAIKLATKNHKRALFAGPQSLQPKKVAHSFLALTHLFTNGGGFLAKSDSNRRVVVGGAPFG